MTTSHVFYHKFCMACEKYRLSPYNITSDSRELFDSEDENILNSEIEVIPLISAWLFDTQRGCDFCGSYDKWNIWDVSVDDTKLDYYKITASERLEIKMQEKTAKECLSVIFYTKYCGICKHNYEEEIMFYPSNFYYSEQNNKDLTRRRLLNEAMKDARQTETECPQCHIISNNFIVLVTAFDKVKFK